MKKTLYFIAAVLTAIALGFVYVFYSNRKGTTPAAAPKPEKVYQYGQEDVFGSLETMDDIKAYLQSVPDVETAMGIFMQDAYYSENEKVFTLFFLNQTFEDKVVTLEQYTSWQKRYRDVLSLIEQNKSYMDSYKENLGVDFESRFRKSEYFTFLQLDGYFKNF